MRHFPVIAIIAVASATSLPAASQPAILRERAAADHVRHGDSLMQQARDSLDPTRYAPAREAYEHALALDPGWPAAMVGLAWVFNSEHQFAEGARWCNAALALDNNLPDAYALLADGAVELGRYEEALDWCQRALDLRPDLSSYSRAAHVLWLTGHPVRARALMEAAIAAGGGSSENAAWCEAQLATMLFSAGEVDAAARVLDMAMARGARNPHVLAAAARVAAARGDFVRAIDLNQQSIAVAPTHDALADLVDLYGLTGQVDEARRQFARVVAFHASHHTHAVPAQTAANSSEPHFHGNAQLARFFADHRRSFDTAVGEAEAAFADARSIGTADTLAWCYHLVGRTSDAVAMIHEAMKWGTPSPDLHFHAGMIFAQTGDTVRARAELERALALNPAFHPRLAAEARATLQTLGVDDGAVRPLEP